MAAEVERTVGRFLLAAVQSRGPSEYVEGIAVGGAGQRLVEGAVFHGIVGYVYEALMRSGAVGDALPRLKDAYQISLLQHLRALGALRSLGDVLEDALIPWVVVKGPVLAERAHARPGLRSYSDIDLVVDATHFPRAVEALERAGGRVASDNWKHRREQRAGELPIWTATGEVIDLHWHLINSAATRDRFAIPMPNVLERAVSVEVGGMNVRTFDPQDTLLHLLVHTGMSGGNRLLWMKDIERTVATSTIDWDEFVRRARAWKIELVAATMLDKTRRTALADIPHGIIQELGGRRIWLRFTRGVDRLRPPERASAGRSLDRAVSKATKTTTADSAAVLCANSVRWLRNRVDGVPASTLDGQVQSLGLPARDAFLSWVTSQAG